MPVAERFSSIVDPSIDLKSHRDIDYALFEFNAQWHNALLMRLFSVNYATLLYAYSLSKLI